MTKLYVLFIALFCIGSLLTSCANRKINFQETKLVAWNEDTVHNYQIALIGKKFYYNIIHKDSLKERHYHYTGTYSIGTERIYLLFNGPRPDDLSIYLTREASDNYLIQQFNNKKERIFLRILPHVQMCFNPIWFTTEPCE